MKRILFPFLIVLMAAGTLTFFSSCTDGPYGIFYSLENEAKIADGELENQISVFEIKETANYLYLGTSRIRRRDAAGGSWSKVTHPDGMDVCLDLEYYNDGTPTLIASFANFKGTEFGLYTADPEASTLSWTEVTAAFEGKQVSDLAGYDTNHDGISDGVYVSIFESGDPPNFTVYHTTDFSTFNTVNFDKSIFKPIESADYIGTNYVALSGSYLFSSGTVDDQTSGGPSSTADFNSVYYSTTLGSNYLLLSSDNGTIWYSTDGTTWNTLGTDSTKEFTVFTDIGDRVLVGTRGDGYYEITDTSTIQDPSSE
ncbi:MAG: hypothetical protein K9L68_03460, partial [Spirochaetales bacterium]|nr:hypothetical protein [Spirochaetales bacterium]